MSTQLIDYCIGSLGINKMDMSRIRNWWISDVLREEGVQVEPANDVIKRRYVEPT